MRAERREPSAQPNLSILISLLLLPVVVGLLLRCLTIEVVSTVVWQFLFSGFGEEMLYRGYIQSRVNQEYGSPYEVLGARFGPGLFFGLIYERTGSLLASGIAHGLPDAVGESFAVLFGWSL